MRYLLFTLTLFSNLVVFSQSSEGVTQKHSLKFPLPGYAFEQPLNKRMILNVQVDLGGAFTQYGDETSWYLTPIFSIEPRYHYNYFKRLEKGKSVTNNASSYIALTASYISKLSIGANLEPNPAYAIVPKWGTRVPIGQHFSFIVAAGVGIYKEEGYELSWLPDIDLCFEYNF